MFLFPNIPGDVFSQYILNKTVKTDITAGKKVHPHHLQGGRHCYEAGVYWKVPANKVNSAIIWSLKLCDHTGKSHYSWV